MSKFDLIIGNNGNNYCVSHCAYCHKKTELPIGDVKTFTRSLNDVWFFVSTICSHCGFESESLVSYSIWSVVSGGENQ